METALNHRTPETLQAANSPARDFEIVPLRDVPLAEVLQVLNQSLGTKHGDAWFRWKHLDNPFGPSLGWAAVGADGLLGVRLFMPWQLRLGNQVLSAVRPVDTATAVRARGKGIFKALTRHAVAAVARDAETAFIFNTPNRNSRPGYSQMGWSLLPPLAHGIWPAWHGRDAQLATDETVFSAFEKANLEPLRMTTLRRAAAMRWRYSSASGISYEIARLQQSDTPNGIVYCVSARRGIRVLLLQELAGTIEDRRRLLSSVARRERALAFMAATGPGALQLWQGYPLRRGHSVLAIRQLAGCPIDPMKLDSWGLTLGDLEGTI